jgi:hypothetical protein
MTANLAKTWERFRGVLKLYGLDASLLNPPCSSDEIRKVENKLGLELPSMLAQLLSLNDGQKLDGGGANTGIFKSISGWDVYERQVFLGVDDMGKAYRTFVGDRVLTKEFGVGEIPFAIAGSPAKYREAFCINSSTQSISLIWTQHSDLSNPPEWQVYKFSRAKSLTEFIEKQIELYR